MVKPSKKANRPCLYFFTSVDPVTPQDSPTAGKAPLQWENHGKYSTSPRRRHRGSWERLCVDSHRSHPLPRREDHADAWRETCPSREKPWIRQIQQNQAPTLKDSHPCGASHAHEHRSRLF